jgi:hypothetical protein
MIEYRNANGTRIEVAANGRLMPAQNEVNLRSLGCPDWLATRVENSRIERRAKAAMAKGSEPAVANVPTTEELKARAAQVGQQIADDNRRLIEQDELKTRLRAAAGITTRLP